MKTKGWGKGKRGRLKCAHVKVGDAYQCNVQHPWQAPIRAICMKRYENSALVIISSTTNDADDRRSVELFGKTVVPLKRMIPTGE